MILTKENLAIIKENTTAIFIDLKALQENYTRCNVFKDVVSSMVIKADAYNLGAVQSTKALYEVGCKDFFVHHINEVENISSKYNIAKDINMYVLGYTPEHSYKKVVALNAIPTLTTIADINAYSLFAKNQGKKLPAVIQIDTGLTRLGLNAKEQEELINNKHLIANLDIRYIYSHLANASSKEDSYNTLQYERYESFMKHFPNVRQSLSASYVSVMQNMYNKNYAKDMIRWGMAIYGINITNWNLQPMLAVLHYYTTLAQVQEVKKGTKAGYETLWQASRDSIVGTINTGYADGLLRDATDNGGYAIIEGYKVPYIGRISMDMALVDLTDIPASHHKVGSIVQVMGDDIRPNTMASFAHTNPISATLAIRKGKYPWIYLE